MSQSHGFSAVAGDSSSGKKPKPLPVPTEDEDDEEAQLPTPLPSLATRDQPRSAINTRSLQTMINLRSGSIHDSLGSATTDRSALQSLRNATLSVVALNQFSLNRNQPVSALPSNDDPELSIEKARLFFYFQAFCGFWPDSPKYNWKQTLGMKGGVARGLFLLWRLFIYASCLFYVCYPPVARPAFDSIVSGNFVDLLRKEPPWLIGWLFLFTYPYCWFLTARIGGFYELQIRWYYMLRGQFMQYAWGIQTIRKISNIICAIFIVADLGMVLSIYVRYPKEPIVWLYMFIMLVNLGALLCALETLIMSLLVHDKLGRQFGSAYLTRFNTFVSDAAEEILLQHKKLTDGLNRTHKHWEVPLSLSILGMFSGVVVSVSVALFSQIRSNQLFFGAYYFVFIILLVLSLILPARITAVYRSLCRLAEDMECDWSEAANHTAFVQKLQLRDGGYRVMGLTITYAMVAGVIYAGTTGAIFLIYSLNLLGTIDE